MDIFGYQIPAIFGFQIPKLAIVISVAIAFYYIAVFFMRVGMAGLGGMLRMGRGVTAQGDDPRQPISAGSGAGAAVAFNRSAVVATGTAWEDVEAVNAALVALQARKKPMLLRQGDLQASKTAWLIAVFEQAILYRITALVAGAIAM